MRLLLGTLLGWTCLGAAAQSRPQDTNPGGPLHIDRSFSEIDSGKIEEFVPILPVLLKSEPNDPDSTLFGEPELAHGPLETRWNGVPVVLVFFQTQVTTVTRRPKSDKDPKDTSSFYLDRDMYGCVKGYVFVPTSKKGKYKPIFIGDILPNGGDPEIQAVFFANADKDKSKELLVLSSCRFNHRALGLAGTNYDVAVFDDLAQAGKDGLRPMREVEERISARCYPEASSEEGEEGHSDVNGCTSAAEVKSHLKKFGY